MDASGYYAQQCVDLSTGGWKIRWSEYDCEYVATYEKFPSFCGVAHSPHEALLRLTNLIIKAERERAAEMGL